MTQLFSAILMTWLALSILAYRRQKEESTDNMVSKPEHKDITSHFGERQSLWMHDNVAMERVGSNLSESSSSRGDVKSDVCHWLNFYFETRLEKTGKQAIETLFNDQGVVYPDTNDLLPTKLSVVLISGAISKYDNLNFERTEWTDLDLWIPDMAIWKPKLAKPMDGYPVSEAKNQLLLPPIDHQNYCHFAKALWGEDCAPCQGSTVPCKGRSDMRKDMPEVDAWDPVGEDKKMLTNHVYKFFQGNRFTQAGTKHHSGCEQYNSRFNYFEVEEETPAAQLAFKIGMFSGARQRPNFDDAADPYQVAAAGESKAQAFRYKPTDLSDTTGVLFFMAFNPKAHDWKLWAEWVRHIMDLGHDPEFAILENWFKVYPKAEKDIFYFTPAKGCGREGQSPCPTYKATFQNWLNALVPHYCDEATGECKDLCRFDSQLNLGIDKPTSDFITKHSAELQNWQPKSKYLTPDAAPNVEIA
mmetsp:Transcript_87852/g.155526  ORF Transcript_87852/g.155526 Transcript_87852/m.155526 type:complete len:471 (-) Transcript_87852:95-1507(-)